MIRRAALFLVCSACAAARPTPAAKPATPPPAVEVDFRAQPPPPGPEPEFVPPTAVASILPNGLHVLHVPLESGLLSVALVVRGPAYFPNERPAAVTATTRALFGGSATWDAHALRREFEAAIGRWTTSVWSDRQIIAFTASAEKAARCVEIVADLVAHPLLAQDAITTEATAIVETNDRSREDPQAVAYWTLLRALRGEGHAYATPWSSSKVASPVDRAEVQRIHREVFDPGTSTLVLAGPIDVGIAELVARTFGAWRASPHAPARPPSVSAPPAGPRFVVLDRPGATQAHIAVGALAPSQNTDDWSALVVLHEVLGARPTSRLTTTLRDRSAVMWGGESHLEPTPGDTLFYWSSSASTGQTPSVLSEIERQLADLRDHPLPVDALESAKAMSIGELPGWFETTPSTANTLTALAAFNLPPDHYAQWARRVHAVDAASLQRVARSVLASDSMRTVVVGDWERLKGPLQAFAPGPIDVRPFGKRPR